jgi:putative spermidine/putrescine transport system permease protein
MTSGPEAAPALGGLAATSELPPRPRRRRAMAPSAIVWLVLGTVYFLIPLVATLLFSLKSVQTGKCCSLAAYGFVIHSSDFWHTIKISFLLAIETIVIGLAIFVPTVYLVHLKLPRLRPVIAFIALVPFVVPPIVMVVGLLDVYKGAPGWFYDQPWGFLAAAYLVLAFPYMFFALDAGFRSIDVHTLTEASQSLGASWPTTLVKVILPNIRSAALAGSFLALAIVMGEFTIANLAQFHTFPIYLEYVNESQPYGAAALTLLSFGITWGAMLGLLFLGRRRGARPTLIAGAR